jgi:hypothetical protein
MGSGISFLIYLIPWLRIRIHFIRIRIQHFRLNTNPDPDPIRIRIQSGSRALMTKIEEKNYSWKKNLIFFWSKTAIFLSIGFHKVRSYKRSSQKRPSNTFKTWSLKNFFTFVDLFCPLGSGSGFRIRIRIHWHDWIRIQSGSATLPDTGAKLYFWKLCWKLTKAFLPSSYRVRRVDGAAFPDFPLTECAGVHLACLHAFILIQVPGTLLSSIYIDRNNSTREIRCKRFFIRGGWASP